MFFSAAQNEYQLGDLKVKLKQNNRAKKIILKIKNGDIELVYPKRAGAKRAINFLQSKQGWLKEKLQHSPKKIKLNIGCKVNLLGVEYEIKYGGRRGRSRFEEGEIIICGDELLAPKKIKNLLMEYLKQEIVSLANKKTSIINQSYNKISIRSTTSRWGSCSASGNLSFCWKLVFAPADIVEYLVAHEVAHLAEMNHSKAFWQVVEKLCPNYEEARDWLKSNGKYLQSFE